MAIKPRWLTPAEESAWRKYIVASRRLLEALDDDLATNGLSLSDYEILVHLSDAPERRLRMSDLAEKTILSRSRLSHRIKYM
ncbi:MAG: MarR family transcriptional regulator, partial [Candidatus Nanopelagicaceae bacterium]